MAGLSESPEQLLDVVLQAGTTSSSDPFFSALYIVLFSELLEPFLSQLYTWLDDAEFPNGLLPWSTGASLRNSSSGSNVPGLSAVDLRSQLTTETGFWDTSLRLSLPQFFEPLRPQLLRALKSMYLLRLCDPMSPVIVSGQSHLPRATFILGLNMEAMPPRKEAKGNLAVAASSRFLGLVEALMHSKQVDVPMDISCGYLRSSLEERIRVIDQAVLKLFLDRFRVISHLEVLKRFVLLGSGDFVDELLSSMTDRWGSTALRRQNYIALPSDLNAFLKSALQTASVGLRGLSTEDDVLGRLSFASREDVRTRSDAQDPRHEPFLQGATESCGADVLDRLELRFDVSFPVCLVFEPRIMRRYDRLFALLLRLKRSYHVVKESFKTWTSCRAACLGRFEIHQWIGTVHAYVFEDVIECSWFTLLGRLHPGISIKQMNMEPISNLDEFRRCHQDYIDGIYRRCFMTEDAKSLLSLLNSLLALSLRLADLWGCADVDIEMRSLYEKFENLAVMFFGGVRNRASAKPDPAIVNLVQRLDFNGYFSKFRVGSAETLQAVSNADECA